MSHYRLAELAGAPSQVVVRGAAPQHVNQSQRIADCAAGHLAASWGNFVGMLACCRYSGSHPHAGEGPRSTRPDGKRPPLSKISCWGHGPRQAVATKGLQEFAYPSRYRWARLRWIPHMQCFALAPATPGDRGGHGRFKDGPGRLVGRGGLRQRRLDNHLEKTSDSVSQRRQRSKEAAAPGGQPGSRHLGVIDSRGTSVAGNRAR